MSIEKPTLNNIDELRRALSDFRKRNRSKAEDKPFENVKAVYAEIRLLIDEGFTLEQVYFSIFSKRLKISRKTFEGYYYRAQREITGTTGRAGRRTSNSVSSTEPSALLPRAIPALTAKDLRAQITVSKRMEAPTSTNEDLIEKRLCSITDPKERAWKQKYLNTNPHVCDSQLDELWVTLSGNL